LYYHLQDCFPSLCSLMQLTCSDFTLHLENVNKRIDCYFRAHMEYKRLDEGFKIYRKALARFTEFLNLCLEYTQSWFDYRYDAYNNLIYCTRDIGFVLLAPVRLLFIKNVHKCHSVSVVLHRIYPDRVFCQLLMNINWCLYSDLSRTTGEWTP